MQKLGVILLEGTGTARCHDIAWVMAGAKIEYRKDVIS